MIAIVRLPVHRCLTAAIVLCGINVGLDAADPPQAFITGSGPGWVSVGENDFQKVNSADDTWTFKGNEIHCTGQPVSVMRSKKQYTNFELVSFQQVGVS